MILHRYVIYFGRRMHLQTFPEHAKARTFQAFAEKNGKLEKFTDFSRVLVLNPKYHIKPKTGINPEYMEI